MNFCNLKTCVYSDPYKCKENPSLKFTPCIQCNAVAYCSNTCKIQDWSNHKPKCSSSHARAISELNKSDNNITINNSDISGKSSFLQSKKTLKDYELVNGSDIKIADLGKGAYGAVKLVQEKSTNKFFALKIVNKKNLMQNAKPEYLKREIKLQKTLDHPHIIKLFHTFEDNENVYLVLEYAKNGSLFFYLRRKKKCEEKEAFIFFFQTCIGIDYLHKKGILHRDIKPENLLLDEKGNIKLCDFGWCADSSTESRNTFCGTLDYMAPEMLKNQPHDKTVDIWSLGVLLYELLHGFAPFGGINERDKIMKITSYDFKMGEHLTPNARDLISKLMKLNPLERIDFDHIFVHPWLKKFEDDYKMDMTRFRYDPEKSRNRSRSRSPNVSEVRVDKQKDTLDSKAKSPIDKNKEPHNNRFGKNDTDDKRGRSNSPMTSNYKSNNLGMKDVDSSLNVSNISNKMNTSNLNVKVPTDKNTRLEPEKKNSAMVASKSYENLKPLVQNPILNSNSRDNSRDNSIDRNLQKNNDRSKSPENRNRIFDGVAKNDPRFKEEKKIDNLSTKSLNKQGDTEKSGAKNSTNQAQDMKNEKKSYRAAKLSEVDDSILKEIEKANKLEDKLEKMMKTTKELYAQMPPFKSPVEQKKIEIPDPSLKKNVFPETPKINTTPQKFPIDQVKTLPDPRKITSTESNQRTDVTTGLDNPLQNKMTEKNRSPSPLRIEQTNLIGPKITSNEKPYELKTTTPKNLANNEKMFEQKPQRNDPSPQKPREEKERNVGIGISTNQNDRNRSVSPLNNNKTNSNNNERNRSLSPMNNTPTLEKKIFGKIEESTMYRSEKSDSQTITAKFASNEKFTSNEKFESKVDLKNLNESIIPTSDPNYSMQNDSTSEFLMRELNSQKKMVSSKGITNKGMSAIKEQNEEESNFLIQKKKPPKSTFFTEEEKRTTNIGKFLDGIMEEMKIDDKSDNQIFNSLLTITQSTNKKPKDISNESLDKINQEILLEKKKKEPKPQAKKQPKGNEKSMEESQKNRNELTFMEKQESSKKKPKNKHKESDSDDIGNEVSEEETSRRNTALQRNMDESINRSKSQERQKIAPGKMGKEDWMNPEENSLDDDMDNYFKKLEDDKNKKEMSPKFGKTSKKDDIEKHLDKKINEHMKLNNDEKDEDEKFNFKSKKKEKKTKEMQIGNDEDFKEKPKKKNLEVSSKKPIKNNFKEEMNGQFTQEYLEIPDSDIDKENTVVVDDEELNNSLKDQGNKMKKKGSSNSSLANKANKMMEKMKNIKKEEGIHEETSNHDESGSEKDKKEEAQQKKNQLKHEKTPIKNNKIEKSQKLPHDLIISGKKDKKQQKNQKNIKENPKDYENEREKVMKQFYDSFALIEEGKFDRNNENKLYYSFDDKAKQEMEEKEDEGSEEEEGRQKPENRNRSKNKQKGKKMDEHKLDKLIQSKLDKALLDPQVAKKWLENQNYDKDLDLNFLPKKLANNSLSNYKDSNERLKKKNDQLKVLMTQLDSDEDESKRISKISKRSYIMEKAPNVKSVEEMGFFEKLLFSLGCFKRNDPSSSSSSNKEKTLKELKKKKKQKK